jgi:hypothetical protein
MLVKSVGTLVLAGWFCSCGPPPRQSPSNGSLPAAEGSDMPLRGFGQLQVFITSQTTDGRNLKLRGLIRNPYLEPIEGVRLVFRILSAPSADARELDRMYKVLDDHLAGGEQTALRWDLQTMYAQGGGGFQILAFAIKRGGQPLPAPPDWKE